MIKHHTGLVDSNILIHCEPGKVRANGVSITKKLGNDKGYEDGR